MKILSVCIPNYNRFDKLKSLVNVLTEYILQANLEEYVEICISDDHSEIDPYPFIEQIRRDNENVSLIYHRNEKNMGMDYNFLNSVRISRGEFCWIMGNDDLPTEGSMKFIIDVIRQDYDGMLDILVTPFDQFDENNNYAFTVFPLKKNDAYMQVFNTREEGCFSKLIGQVNHNSGLFAFLSNVVFRKARWMRHGDMFSDKMNTIFIQMYMNIQTLVEGGCYYYIQQKIVKNFADKVTNSAFDRWGRIAVGLADVVTYFFRGEERDKLLELFVAGYMRGDFWELPDGHPWKDIMSGLNIKKAKLYNQYYIPQIQRKQQYAGRNVMIFGAGEYGVRTQEEMENCYANIIGFVDNDVAKQGRMKNGYPIYSLEALPNIYKEEKANIVVANSKSADIMVEQLADCGIKVEDISMII